MNTDRVITAVFSEKHSTKYEQSHPIEIQGMGVVVVDQKFCISIKEANSLCNQLAKATLLASLKQMKEEVAVSKPNTKRRIYVKVGDIGYYKDGGTKEYKGWDGKHYFVDHRISSKTKGEIYDRYPSDKDAVPLTNVRLVETHACPDHDEYDD